MKACLIFNPTARGDKAARLQCRLEELRAQCQLRPTFGAGTAVGLACEAVADGFDLIIAAGGDGTVNEVLNGIGLASEGIQRTRLGLIPLGTVNVFAKEIGMPTSLRDALAIIEEGRERRIDIGRADYVSKEGHPRHRYFLQIAGAGVDSRAIDLVVWEQKKRWGRLAYVWAALRALRCAPWHLDARTERDSYQAAQVLIGNGQFYGGRLRLFPEARFDDGTLDATLLPRVSWPALLRGAWGLTRSALYTTGGLEHVRFTRLSLTSPSRVPFHVEGDNVGYLPATFSLHNEKARIVIP